MKPRGRAIEYPYFGRFYQMAEPDLTLPLDQRDMCEELVYETVCDIQEVSKANNPVLIATYSVFLPFNLKDDIPFHRGSRFEGSMNGLSICGLVTNVVLSQLGGIVAYVKDYDSGEGI